jgi:hypothetical protein
MKQKYKWSDEIPTMIDWQVHSIALTHFSTGQQTSLKKFLHQWLPVNAHPGQALPATARTCPACQLADESNSHFLKCTSLHTKWLEIIITSEIVTNTVDTDRHLNKILAWAITTPSGPTAPFPLQSIPIKYHALVQDQQHIGWDQVIYGRWTRTWANHLDSLHPNKGEQLASKKLADIWRNVLRLWYHRCDLQHKPDEHTPTLHQQQLHPKVQAIYAQKDKLDQIDKLILDQPIFTTMKLPPKQLKEWILITESFVKQGLKRAKRRLQAKNHAITSFFLPQSNRQAGAATTTTSTPNPTPLINPTACENFRPP